MNLLDKNCLSFPLDLKLMGYKDNDITGHLPWKDLVWEYAKKVKKKGCVYVKEESHIQEEPNCMPMIFLN